MDVLSDVIAALRTGQAHSARTERYNPWVVHHPPFDGAGCHVVFQGTCWLTPQSGSPIALKPGDVVFLAHGIGHTLAGEASIPTDGTTMTMLSDIKSEQHQQQAPEPRDSEDTPTVLLCGAYLLDNARSHPLVDELPEVIHLPNRVGQPTPLRSAVELLGSELGPRRPGADATIPALLDVLLIYILRSWYDQQPEHDHGAVSWAAALRDPSINMALQNIHDSPGHPWTVQELASKVGLSRAAFARHFSELVGRPPLTYLTWWRMTTAAQLLRDSEASMRTIAQQVGYTSEFAFANAFKREYGLAPGMYRRQPDSRAVGA